jgi:hypothetical protein
MSRAAIVSAQVTMRTAREIRLKEACGALPEA